MCALEIRTEVGADHQRVFDVERAAFGSELQARLVDELRASSRPQLSLVAVLGDDLVAHIFFSPVTFDAEPAPPAAQLSPVAVMPPFQKQGIGSALVQAGLEQCRLKGWHAVFLVGNPLYYSRFGFQMATPHGLSCSGPHGPFLQFIELQDAALAGVRGSIIFHPAFDEIESS